MPDSSSRNEIRFRPLGRTFRVRVPVRESERPECCPDRLGCQPFYLPILSMKEDLDKGYSGACFGYCGPRTFAYKKAVHWNDISHCIMTPLKGVIRFFNCIDDLGADFMSLRKMLQLLHPLACESCKTTHDHIDLCNYIIQEKPERRKWLCLGCAVRLGVVEFHPENIGTGRSVYY